MKARLNAFDRSSGANFSEAVEASSPAELTTALFSFEQKVPFARFYYDNEILELSDEEKKIELQFREVIE